MEYYPCRNREMSIISVPPPFGRLNPCLPTGRPSNQGRRCNAMEKVTTEMTE